MLPLTSNKKALLVVNRYWDAGLVVDYWRCTRQELAGVTTHQVFDGSLSADEAQQISGVDALLTQDEAMTMLRDLSKKHSVVYTAGQPAYSEHCDFVLNPAQYKLSSMLERTFNDVQDCRQELAKPRAIK